MCDAGQACEEKEGVCRDIVRCEDPRTDKMWKDSNLEVADTEDFIEDGNYTFTCANKFFVDDYVR